MSASEGFNWQGREDKEDGPEGQRWHNQINGSSPNKIALYGYASDLGVAANKGRVGAKEGPNAIRKALANFAWHLECGVTDAGNTDAQDSVESTQQHYADRIESLLNQHALTIGLGGGHDIAFGSYQGLQQWLRKRSASTIGVINFDAHFDLRLPSPKASSGTPFYQIAQHCEHTKQPFHYACLGVADTSNTKALFNRAAQLEVAYLRDLDANLINSQVLLEPLLKQVDELYVTVCLDVFSSEKAPGVSAPSALGVRPEYVIELIRWLAEKQDEFNYNWRLADIAEMNPRYDIDGRTAKLAARLIYEITSALVK
jgi:formiminoglutamase